MNGYPGVNWFLTFKLKFLMAGSRRLDLHVTAKKQEYRRALRKLGRLGDENNGPLFVLALRLRRFPCF